MISCQNRMCELISLKLPLNNMMIAEVKTSIALQLLCYQLIA